MHKLESHACSAAALDTRRTGFTLAELLTLLAILALLASLQLPVLARATGRSKRAQCATNLRQIALALHTYGTENNDRLPTLPSGSWGWDVPWPIGPALDRYGMNWRLWYCPGTAPRFTDTDNYRLYNFVPNGGYRVLGYALTFPGVSGLIATNINATLTPQAVQNGPASLPPPFPSKRVLVSDANLTASGQSNPNLKATYNWTEIAGGYSKHHLSPHLSGMLPAGGNVVMLDAHVEWRNLDAFLPRLAGNVPIFWW